MKLNTKTKQIFLLTLFLTISSNHSVLANPTSTSKVLQQVGQIMSDDKFKGKEELFKQMIVSYPTKESYVALANLYISENKNKQAIVNYQKATLIDPTDPKLFVAMSIAYLHLGLYSMSKVMAEQAITLDPALAHAGKIIKYIDKKQEVLKKASSVGEVK
jgi:tetratricopeptide (TPR) repeat protein